MIDWTNGRGTLGRLRWGDEAFLCDETAARFAQMPNFLQDLL